MVGLCGYSGTPPRSPNAEHLGTTSHASTQVYDDGDLQLTSIRHPFLEESQPAVTENEARIWIWGEIYGYEDDQRYHSLVEAREELSNAEICAELYAEYGSHFVETLNGDFCGVLYDPTKGEIVLITDLLGSRPLYYSQNDGLVFSTSLHSLSHVSDRVSSDRLAEYLLFSRVLGPRTLFHGISAVPPATTVAFDIETGDRIDQNTYWRPSYSPVKESYTSYVRRLCDIFSDAMAARTHDPGEYGLLLSGGSDSRLIVAATAEEFTAYHLNESMNREAEVAEEVARRSDSTFRFVERSLDHYPSFLTDEVALSNLNGAFTAAHTTGLRSRFRDDIDVLTSGHWSDTLLEAYVPRLEASLPIVNQRIEIPLYSEVSSATDILNLFTGHGSGPLWRSFGGTFKKTEIDYSLVADSTLSSRQIIRNGLTERPNSVEFYGIEFDDLTDLALYGYYYPLTNAWSHISHELALQQIPYRNPFLDRRVIQLSTSLPIAYRLRKTLVDDAVSRMDPDLAHIKSSNTGISLQHSFATEYFLNYINEARRLIGNRSGDTASSRGSWPDHGSVIRELRYVDDIVDDRRHLSALTNISFETFDTLYQSHLDGEEYTHTIHAFLTAIAHPSVALHD